MVSQMIPQNPNFINEIIELAEAEGIAIPDEYKAFGMMSGVKISTAHGSVCGEKTETSIRSKVSRRVFGKEPNFRMIDLKDPIRAKIVVEKYQHVPRIMEMIRRENPNTRARLQHYQDRNYRGNHVSTMIDGLMAEIQLVSPVQGLFDHITSSIYAKIRENTEDTHEHIRLKNLAKHIYDTLWGNTNFWNTDIEIRSKAIEYGSPLQNDVNRLNKDADVQEISDEAKKEKLLKSKEDLLQVLSLSPKLTSGQGNPIVTTGGAVLNHELVVKQAKLMHQIGVRKQPKLVKLANDVFDEYKHLLQKGQLPADLNKKQHFVSSLYNIATDKRILELDNLGIADPAQHMRDHYGEEMSLIEKNYVLPAINQQDNKPPIKKIDYCWDTTKEPIPRENV